jgi:light-regulated signal transduction histidine kinase (bacteriophytochrome)
LISDILDLSKVSRAEIRKVPVNLSGMAYELSCILRETEPGRNVAFEIENGVMITGDPALLQLVMQNLLENAWKYSARRESALIKFGTIQSCTETTCFVCDNGIGFDMADSDQIFGVFQRLNSSAEYEGTGIGLATVQRIIHRHNGRIWAEGSIDQGATFYFSIPQT